MKRRTFAATLALGTGISAAGWNTEDSRSVAPGMHVGCQRFDTTSVEDLQFLKRHGVDHICGREPKLRGDLSWDTDDLERMKELTAREGISLDMLPLPLSSSGIDRVAMPNILLGRSPERDREIEAIQSMIRTAAEHGIPTLKYNMTILPVLRTGRTPGRGGSSYSTWEYVKAPKDQSLTTAGVVDHDTFFERIAYFIEQIIPVAEEFRIRLACHIADPGTIPGYRGIDRALGTTEGLKAFSALSGSPYHGFNFCIGSAAEQLADPGREIYDVVRYFGEQNQLFLIHFRNIQGTRDNFREVYPDNGDLDMYRLMRVLREGHYTGMVCPDHMPTHPNDPQSKQAFAFGFGYIKALIQATEKM